MSSDTLIGAYLMLEVTNSSQTWVSGTVYSAGTYKSLFSRDE